MKFLRTHTRKYVKLGSRQKSKQKWRTPTGIHSKLRQRRKGKHNIVEIGYRTEKETRGKIQGKEVSLIRNLRDAEKAKKGSLIIIAKVGKKKRQEIINKLNGFEILNKK